MHSRFVSGELPNSPETHPKHIVAVFCLIRNPAGDILMIDSPRRGWELPGGQVEEGEDLVRALEREIMEETGTKAGIGRLAGIYSRLNPPFMVLFGFLGQYRSGELSTSDESQAVAWVPAGQVTGRIAHPAIRGRVSDLLAFDGQIVYRSYQTDPYQIIRSCTGW